jgi:NIMA (never in mitosis gene a)-related kinase 2
MHSAFSSISCDLGSFGSVSKIRHKETGEVWVWKEMRYKGISEKERKLLCTEVNVMRTIPDPHIVKYYGRIQDKENMKLYILMEYCENGDLKSLIDKHKASKEPIKEQIIWEVLSKIVQALSVCHNNSSPVIHRDIKPANIFIGKYEDYKLGDFGLSKILTDQSILATTNVGTPYYMSPEQVGSSNYNEK